MNKLKKFKIIKIIKYIDIIAIGDVYRYIKFKLKNIKKNMAQFRNGKYYIFLFITNIIEESFIFTIIMMLYKKE